MTKHRRPEIQFPDAPRGTCRWCGQYIVIESGEKSGEINKRRRWHQTCVEIYNASDPREARRRIQKRDRGHCASCGVDTYKVRRELMKLKGGRAQAIRDAGYKPRKSFWELDHIVPLIDEGSHEDDNLQTLCTPCHASKTADEARERAKFQREATPVIISRAKGKATRKAAPSSADADPKPKKTKSKSLDELLDAADTVNARVKQFLAERDKRASRTSETPTA